MRKPWFWPCCTAGRKIGCTTGYTAGCSRCSLHESILLKTDRLSVNPRRRLVLGSADVEWTRHRVVSSLDMRLLQCYFLKLDVSFQFRIGELYWNWFVKSFTRNTMQSNSTRNLITINVYTFINDAFISFLTNNIMGLWAPLITSYKPHLISYTNYKQSL